MSIFINSFGFPNYDEGVSYLGYGDPCFAIYTLYYFVELQVLEFRTQIRWKAKPTTIILIVAMYIYTLFVLL